MRGSLRYAAHDNAVSGFGRDDAVFKPAFGQNIRNGKSNFRNKSNWGNNSNVALCRFFWFFVNRGQGFAYSC